jgi:hypothetical protein
MTSFSDVTVHVGMSPWNISCHHPNREQGDDQREAAHLTNKQKANSDQSSIDQRKSHQTLFCEIAEITTDIVEDGSSISPGIWWTANYETVKIQFVEKLHELLSRSSGTAATRYGRGLRSRFHGFCIATTNRFFVIYLRHHDCTETLI